MARPKKKAAEKYAKQLPPVRCTESEYAGISARAAQASMTITAFMRQMALTGQVTVQESQVDFALIQQLKGIGNNLNQLTRKAHVRDEFPEGLQDVFDRLQDVFDQLLILK